jgi:hypothetical protein
MLDRLSKHLFDLDSMIATVADLKGKDINTSQ